MTFTMFSNRRDRGQPLRPGSALGGVTAPGSPSTIQNQPPSEI